MEDNTIEVWLRMYGEQVRHARHHETLRMHSTNIIIVISAAVLAFLSSNGVSPLQHYILASFLILVNVYGLVMSLKHYERNRLHVAVSSQYRDVISKHSVLQEHNLNKERESGHKRHKVGFRRVMKIRAYQLWYGLHIILILMALILLVCGRPLESAAIGT